MMCGGGGDVRNAMKRRGFSVEDGVGRAEVL